MARLSSDMKASYLFSQEEAFNMGLQSSFMIHLPNGRQALSRVSRIYIFLITDLALGLGFGFVSIV